MYSRPAARANCESRVHWHLIHHRGDGGCDGPYVGHRVAHCHRDRLPPHKCGKNLGYHLIDVSGIDATESDVIGVFDTMNVVDRETPEPCFAGTVAVEFRREQPYKIPGLDTRQWGGWNYTSRGCAPGRPRDTTAWPYSQHNAPAPVARSVG